MAKNRMAANAATKQKPTTETRRHGGNQNQFHRGDAEARRKPKKIMDVAEKNKVGYSGLDQRSSAQISG